jgi:outer membrane protein assembly factor BamB
MKNKKMIYSIFAMLFLISIAVSLILPLSNAQSNSDYRTKKTYAVCGLMPETVGVGQETLLFLGVTDYLLNPEDGFSDITVSVTKPDGSVETLGPFRTDSTGATGYIYIPEEEGNYTFQTHFPAQWYNWTSPPMFDPDLYGNIYYEASDSEEVTLVVQKDFVEAYPESPLPDNYWERPIDAQHREWAVIAGNWLSTPSNSYAPYNDGPETAHILWTKSLTTGGLTGGFLGDKSQESGDAYEGKWADSVILNGILYYNRYASGFGSGWAQQGIVAVDLRTGEELWFRNNTRLAFGQTFYWESFNMAGVFSYIWETTSTFDMTTFQSVTTWNAYDPFTGEWQYSITNPPTGTMFATPIQLTGPRGEILIYEVNLQAGWMALWNSTRVVMYSAAGMSEGSWGSAANTQRVFNGTNGYQWNKTIPDLPGEVGAILDDCVIGTTATGINMGGKPVAIWSLSLKPGDEGRLLYNTTWLPPEGDLAITVGEASLEDGVFTLVAQETRQLWGFDLNTGKQIWGPTEPQTLLQIYGISGAIADGKLYSVGYGGIVYCYDVKTGDELWTYEVADPYNEILWSTNWPIFVAFITDGKIYLTHYEHSAGNALPRGAPFLCLDVETGAKIWELPIRSTNWGGQPIIGDSIIAMFNTYDNQIYAIGKGQTATTVSASPKVSTNGDGILIEGTVTDQSPGAKDTPAVSDECMSEWMKHLYLQFEIPANVTGVEVSLDATDQDGNPVHIDYVTSDMSGTFTKLWTPDNPGEYTVTATFMGSKAYYSSYGETTVGIQETAENTAPATSATLTMADIQLYFIGTAIAIIIAIVLVGLLLIRRKP